MFEVLLKLGDSFLQERITDESVRWQYGLVAGEIDTEDKTVVELYREDYLICTYSNVLRVGDVTDETTLQSPLQPLTKRCQRCGFLGNREWPVPRKVK